MLETESKVEKRSVTIKKKRTLLLGVCAVFIVFIGIVGYRYLQRPMLAKQEFTFAYGEAIPTNSAAYFHHGLRYEDVEFDAALFSMQELGSYEVAVTYYDKEYVLSITIRDENAPIIQFREADPIDVIAIKGKALVSSIFTIEDESAYTYEMRPSADKIQDGKQSICVLAVDEYGNEAKQCKDVTIKLTTYSLQTTVSADSIEELVTSYIKEKGLSTTTFGFFYYSVTDQEEYLYNETALFNAASTIKVPLNMLYYDRLADGTIKADTAYTLTSNDIEEGDGETAIRYKLKQAVPLTFLQEQSIVNSDNTATNMLIRGLGGFSTFRRLLCEYDEQAYPSRFYTENVINMRYMLSVLKHLYENKEKYQPLLAHMEHASEGLYLQKSSDDFTIAQKYGLYDANLHTIGIVSTPNPYIVGIYTNNVIDAEDIIVELNQRLIAYQLQKL